MITGSCRHPVLLLAALSLGVTVSGGCMRSTELPRTDVESVNAWHGNYRIETGSTHFIAHDFTTTDSTLVITRLSGADRQFGRIQMPVTIPLSNVQKVSKEEVDVPKTGLIVVGGALLLGGIIVALILGGSDSY
jgi:hypothetical protein